MSFRLPGFRAVSVLKLLACQKQFQRAQLTLIKVVDMIDPMTEASSPSRDKSLDWLRGIFIFCVLLLHAEIISGIGRSSIPGYLNMVVGPILMPMFFLLSGMLGAGALDRRWSDFFERNILRLLWPYFVWGIVYVFAVTLIEQKFPLTWPVFVMLFTRPAELGPTWYLAYLAVFFIGARLLRRVPPAATMLVFAAAAIILPLTGLGTTDALIPAAVFFLGLELKRSNSLFDCLWKPLRRRYRIWKKPVLVCVLCVLIFSPYWMGDALRDNGFATLWILCATVVVLTGAKYLFDYFGSPWAVNIGKDSLAFYLTHWPVMLIIQRLNEEWHVFTPDVAFWALLMSSLAVGFVTSHLTSEASMIRAFFEPPQQVSNLVRQLLPQSPRESYSIKSE